MRIILFDGQGSFPTLNPSYSPSLSSFPTSEPPASTPLATLFSRQVCAAISARLAQLPPSTYDALHGSAIRSIFSRLRSGDIVLPTADPELLRHPLVALPSLYITQVLRLLEDLETDRVTYDAHNHVIGFSSGLLPALLVATSFPSRSLAYSANTQVTILRNALALLDVAVLLGVESQVARDAMLAAGAIALDDPAREQEWSAVILGETRETLEEELEIWNLRIEDTIRRIHLTAQTSDTCHTVSGLPSSLREFLSYRNTHSPAFPTPSINSTLSNDSSDVSLLERTASAALESQLNRSLSPTLSFSNYRISGAPLACSPIPEPVEPCTPTPAPFAMRNFRDAREPSTTKYQPTPTPSAASSRRQSTLSSTKSVGIYTLFHTGIAHLHAVRKNVLAGLFCSRVHASLMREKPCNACDVLEELRLGPDVVLYDTHTGSEVSSSLAGRLLIERVLDMILLERVEFLNTLKCIIEMAKSQQDIEILNYGPGSGLARSAMRSLKERTLGINIMINDVSTSQCPKPSQRPSGNSSSPEPIAIVGMAVNFPNAHDTSELWRLLEMGLNTVEEIPQSRFSIAPYVSETNPNQQMKTRFGCFLPDNMHSSFDNALFRISPREARALDPQMRVLMRVGLQATEAAGLVVEDFSGERTTKDLMDAGIIRSEDVGCFVGVATNDYVLNLRNDIGVHYATGTLPAFLAGRLAYALHLTGPSIVLNTACSSSLVAIHQACRALLAGDCKAALAGGVNVVTSPDMYIGLDRAHFLSSTGNCKPWDASADGYCRAEGCGMFVLKRLSDAISSSDNILGVIRGTEVNQSASAVSITRPHGETQAALFRSLLKKADVRPEEVSLVEAHGTGTQAGDPEELSSLREVLSPNCGRDRSQSNMLTITSIKANTGHAEAASGAASLAKVLLMFRHKSVPTQIGLVNLNPKISPLDRDFTRINTTGSCVDWKLGPTGRRIALVNNFGAAGSNAAMLVEEAPAVLPPSACVKESSDQVVLALSAETESALIRLRDAYISSMAESSFVDFAYTATSRRKLRPWRMAVAAESATGAVEALLAASPVKIAQSSEGAKKIIFVFSGQGGQHLRMGQQLYKVSTTFRAHVNASHEKLLSWGYPGVLGVIDAKDPKVSGLQKVDELVAFQCAIFVLECALCDMWESWGISPDAVIGHSLGEYAALVSAGVLSQDTGLRLVARRARLMALCKQNASSMLVVHQSSQSTLEMFATYRDCNKLSIACFNGPAEVVVGGPNAQLRRLETLLGKSGAKFARVNVPFAYHTSAMDPILNELSDFARKFDFKAPRIPIASNVVGAVVKPGDASVFDSNYFAKHCLQPVLFDRGILNLIDCVENIGAFIEIGPHPTTLPMFSSLANNLGAASLPSLNRKMTARSSLSTALSQMFLFRTSVIWGKAHQELYPASRCMEIPTYPLNETNYWMPYIEEATGATLPTQHPDCLKRFSFLTSWTQKPSLQDGNISEFETPIDRLAEYITGHKVASHSLCPASVYYELALSAATCTLEFMENGLTDILSISDTQFTHPLVYDGTTPLVIRTSINVHPRGGKYAGTFSISSVANGKELHVHCTGFFQRHVPNTLSSKLQWHSGNIQLRKASLLSAQNDLSTETLRSRTIYDLIFPRVVQYSKLYQSIISMTLDENTGEGMALVRLAEEQITKPFAAQPVFMDTLLHAAGFLINRRASCSEAYICRQVDSMKMLPDIDYSTMYEVYCTTASVGDDMVVADTWAIEAKEPRKVVAYMKRMHFSRVRLNSFTKVLSRSVESYDAPASPTPSVRHFEQCATPLIPPKLGSPFRPTQRPHSSSSASSVTAVSGTFDTAYSVIKLVAETCGVPMDDVNMNSVIADLGVDSLIWIEIASQFKLIVQGASFDVSELMISKTVGDLIDKVSKCNPQFSPTFAIEPRAPVVKLATPTLHILDPPIAEKASDSGATLLSRVKDVLGNVLDIPVTQLSETDTLDSLGLDSLGSIEALQNLQEEFRLSLPYDFFRDYLTVDAVCRYILNALDARSPSRQSNSSAVSNTKPLVKTIGPDRCLSSFQSCRSDGGASPLFLIHDGSGLSHCYSRLGNLGRSFWGISNPKLLSGDCWSGGIPEMAGYYISQICPIVTRNGCVLGGWSFGGVVAFHMAVELINAGIRVAGVVLIDSPSPFTEQPLSEDLINSVIQASSHTANASELQVKVIELARTQMGHATRALVNYNPLEVVSQSKVLPNVVMLRCREAFPMSSLPGFASSMGRMPFLEDRSDPQSTVRDWERLIGRDVPVLDIPGHHFEPFSAENIPGVTSQLIKAIDLLESNAL